MKTVKISTSSINHLNKQPLVCICGQNQQYKGKLLVHLLTSQGFYSKKYGRILYIGQRRYKSQMIVHDESNTFDTIDYMNLLDKIDDAKNDGIVNMLLVFNSKSLATYKQIISKIISSKNVYLQGIISIMVNLPNSQTQLQIIQKFNTFFAFDGKLLQQWFGFKQLQQKRKKDVYVYSENKLTVYKDITN